MCPRFSFVIALTEVNKVKDYRVPQNTNSFYNFVLGVAVEFFKLSKNVKWPTVALCGEREP